MVDETLQKLEQVLERAGTIDDGQRAALQQLVGRLKTEIGELSENNREHAQSIAGFTQISAHEATRSDKNPQLLNLSLEGMAHSVSEFEVSHPRLFSVVNSIHQMLSNIGL